MKLIVANAMAGLLAVASLNAQQPRVERYTFALLLGLLLVGGATLWSVENGSTKCHAGPISAETMATPTHP